LNDGVDAAAIARELFGVDGTATALPGEHDRNFRIETADSRYVLKLQRGDPAELAFQDAALERIGRPRLIGSAAWDGATARLLEWIDGEVWASTGPWESALLSDLGRYVASVDAKLKGLEHPRMRRAHRWNMVGHPALEPDLREVLDPLPWQVIHNDANEYNILVGPGRRVAGLIDFGDIVYAPRICGLAVACAYAMLGQTDPLGAILPVVAGYHAEAPLTPGELAVLYPLIRTRHAMSIQNAAAQLAEQPDNAYLAISQAPIAAVVERLDRENAELAHYRLRDACGYPGVPTEPAVAAFLATAEPASVIRLEDGGPGGYLELRDWYTGDAFATADPAERRTVHMAVDVWQPAGEEVRAAFTGVVEGVEYRPDDRDFGGVVVLRHATPDGTPFFTLYGHLSRASAESLAAGDAVTAGQPIGMLGTEAENGGWPPHVHFQVLTTLLGMGTGVHGVAAPSQLGVWRSVCLDPGVVLRHGAPRRPDPTTGS
jgi:Ser/Thr protein kinase RdoA (MazF antagonist)